MKTALQEKVINMAKDYGRSQTYLHQNADNQKIDTCIRRYDGRKRRRESKAAHD